jgi:hypothetical protein
VGLFVPDAAVPDLLAVPVADVAVGDALDEYDEEDGYDDEDDDDDTPPWFPVLASTLR